MKSKINPSRKTTNKTKISAAYAPPGNELNISSIRLSPPTPLKTKEKIEAFINFKKQKDYLENIQGQQQSSLQSGGGPNEQLPITQPQAVASVVQPSVAPAAAGSAVAAGPKTTRERIIEDDPFLKDLA